MEKKTLRIAVAGAGYFSQFHYDAWSRIDKAEVVCLCDLNTEAATAMATKVGNPPIFSDAAAMLDATRPDIVDIVTPPATHPEIVRLAAERGIHVICQKPLAPSYGEAEAMIAAAERAGVLFVAHENFRYMPWFRKAKELIETGTLGEIYSIQFRMRPGDGQGGDAYLSRQPRFRELKRLLVHETAIHYIDAFRFLLGEISSVYAHLQKRNPTIAGEDSGYILFEMSGGRTALFDGNRLADHATDDCRITMGEMLLEGSRGTLTLDGRGRLRQRAFGSEAVREIEYKWDNRNFGGDCVYLTQKAIVEAIIEGRRPENSGRDYLRNIEIEEAAYRSAASSQKIVLPQGV